MNLKHEMFWNQTGTVTVNGSIGWTLNMKCFEIFFELKKYSALQIWTLNMKCFEIRDNGLVADGVAGWTLNMKCFEILL